MSHSAGFFATVTLTKDLICERFFIASFICRRFFFRVTNALGVPLTIRVLNADYPYDWPPNYSVRATYDREFWFQVCEAT